ncbi:Aste57867_834 [Aphanomyces stellatus]|uniref:Aste57867_834 protein n=1 Tax=Aphanomyces stellatus TaxID=120398 RepID=A0A485K3X5_9STRA|nr:hypothetical protein As57867_000833 [Aphanomyces stellatus]VFT78058.1 Aste57867_834 [Aphanomyces stellatus]
MGRGPRPSTPPKDANVLFQPFLSNAGLQLLQGHVERILSMKHESISSEWIMNTHLLGESWLLDLATAPRLLDAVQTFCGPDITLLQTHLFCKPRGCEATPWHQDGSSDTDIPLATIWISLDDLTLPSSGALLVLPGQHKHNLLPSDPCDHFQFDRVLPASFVRQHAPAVRYALGAGHAAVHHQWLPHASEPNTSLAIRRVIVLRYMATAAVRAAGVPLWRLVRRCRTHEDANATVPTIERVATCPPLHLTTSTPLTVDGNIPHDDDPLHDDDDDDQEELYPDYRFADVYFPGRSLLVRGS